MPLSQNIDWPPMILGVILSVLCTISSLILVDNPTGIGRALLFMSIGGITAGISTIFFTLYYSTGGRIGKIKKNVV